MLEKETENKEITANMMLMLLVLLPILLLFFKHFLFGQIHLPPGPYIWQILINLRCFAEAPHIALRNLAKIYGPLFSFRVGGQIFVVASSPTMAKEILKNRKFSGRYMPSMYYNIPGIAHSSLVISKECDNTWKTLRGIGQNYIFSSKAVESNAPLRTIKVMEMVNYLRTKEGQVVNIEDVTFSTLTNIITNILVSKNLFSVDDLTGKIDQRVLDFIHEVTILATTLGLADIYPILKGVDFWSKGKATHMHETVQLIWGEIIKERRGSRDPNVTRDFFDVLAENNFSNEQIAFLLMELQIAGADTTTVITVWLMLELMKNQEILYRLRDEIANQAVKGDAIDESRLAECEYLNACVKETLRLHSPGPFGIPHRATETCKVSNYMIPKDSVVLVNFWASHLDPESWEDAATFQPERFLHSKADFKGLNYEYIPFSAGQRMCPGSNVANKSLKLMVSTLIQYFDWSLPEGVCRSDLGKRVKFGTTLKMEEPFCLIPKIRESCVKKVCQEKLL